MFDPGPTRVEKQANFDFPGMVETEVTVRQMVSTAETLGLDDAGRFLFSDGRDSPW
jgi:hypothetical protein